MVNYASSQSYKLMRYDENFEFLKDSNRNFYQKLKFLPLNSNKDFYLSFGGEARYQFVAFNNQDWGKVNLGHNNFFLQRYDLHADIHFSKGVRLFAQLRGAFRDGSKNPPPNIDVDHLNIQNLFIDVDLWKNGDKKVLVRAGRQELDYGSSRLISVRDGFNRRLYFTGAKILYSSKRFDLDAFAVMYDTINKGVFDNKKSKQINMWGAYSKTFMAKGINLDLYYIGIRRDMAVFEEGFGPERRHSIGARLYRYGGGFIYNVEAIYQFGTFSSGNINAYTASIDLGYSFDKTKFKPTINLKNDFVSGDRKQGDGNLQTFNPIYPKVDYFSYSPQVGPVNLIAIHPYATVDLLTPLRMQFDVIFNWRYSLQDGVYRPGDNFHLAGSSSSERYIGTAYMANLTYTMNYHIALTSGLQYFKVGPFIDDIIANSKDGLFFNVKLGFKF